MTHTRLIFNAHPNGPWEDGCYLLQVSLLSGGKMKFLEISFKINCIHTVMINTTINKYNYKIMCAKCRKIVV